MVAVTLAVGLALTLLFNAVPALEPAYENRSLHVAIETAAALALGFVATLLIGRFRRSPSLSNLLAFCAAAVLAAEDALFSVLTAILAGPSGFSTWTTAGGGLIGAGLLAASGLASVEPLRRERRAVLITTFACGGALLVLVGGAAILHDVLPAGFDNPPDNVESLRLLDEHPALFVLELLTTAACFVAALAFARRAERERDLLLAWLAIAAALGAVASLNYTLFPSPYTELLYAGDLFAVAAVLALLIGTVREVAAYQAAFASAAVIDERRRVARDLHDGVAQELAFISSQMHWLTKQANGNLPTGQIMESVQRALDESRSAISSLSRPAQEPIHLALAHTAEEVAGRVGARLELDIDGKVAVPPAWEEALPRIVREAVANAVRHGHARTVTIALRDADGIWLRISDDGDGFDPAQPRSNGSFGLISMRERTENLGGEFRLVSAPGHGTSVEILLA